MIEHDFEKGKNEIFKTQIVKTENKKKERKKDKKLKKKIKTKLGTILPFFIIIINNMIQGSGLRTISVFVAYFLKLIVNDQIVARQIIRWIV